MTVCGEKRRLVAVAEAGYDVQDFFTGPLSPDHQTPAHTAPLIRPRYFTVDSVLGR